MKKESLVLRVQRDREGIWDHQDLWVCLGLKDPAECLFLGKPVGPDRRETAETRAYLDRKVHLGLLVQLAQLDPLDQGGPKERRELLGPEAHRDQWGLPVLQEILEMQANLDSQVTPAQLEV